MLFSGLCVRGRRPLGLCLLAEPARKQREIPRVALCRVLHDFDAQREQLIHDCGSCGSPTCRTFAEDIVCGYCNEMFCIHKLKDRLKVMAQQMVELAQMKRE